MDGGASKNVCVFVSDSLTFVVVASDRSDGLERVRANRRARALLANTAWANMMRLRARQRRSGPTRSGAETSRGGNPLHTRLSGPGRSTVRTFGSHGPIRNRGGTSRTGTRDDPDHETGEAPPTRRDDRSRGRKQSL